MNFSISVFCIVVFVAAFFFSFFRSIPDVILNGVINILCYEYV